MVSAVAVNVPVAGRNVTPGGASPPKFAVASTVFVPAAPSVQHTLALPFASVALLAVDPNDGASHNPGSGAMTPPPRVTDQFTGTPCRTVPLWVVIVTTG